MPVVTPVTDPETLRALTTRLTSIQEACREYVTQGEGARKVTFASIRIAADAVAALVEDAPGAEEVREGVNAIHAAVDELAARYGGDEPGLCRVCATQLQEVPLGGSGRLAYCTRCPTPILEAVRSISALTGVDTL